MDTQRFLITAPGLAPFIVWAPSASLALAVGRNYLGTPLDGASVEPFHRP